MASSRRATLSLPHYADTDSGSESDKPTPKAHREQLKKRVSEVYNPDHDQSFSSSPGRVPLRSVNINDDAAEKRRRRKSIKIAANAYAGPSSEGNMGEYDQPEPSRTTRPKQQLASVEQTPVINVPLDVMSSNFEEWMKMATDNKINAANSWNFALIDYFHDMSLLRNNTDNSINFQRASCTLDGCVKIWTSRVDSVGTETGKLLSNLASEGRANDDEEPTSDNPDAQDLGQGKKKKAHRAEATLAKNPLQLRKKLDLEFSVDPLFKKTCADFDEGGAQGLLMNHLSLGVGGDGGMRVVFDASDSVGKVAEEEESEEPEDEVDLTALRKEFLPDLSVLGEKAISHSLSGFSFGKDNFLFGAPLFREDNHPGYDDDNNEPRGAGENGDYVAMDGEGPPVEDFFQGAQDLGDDFGGGPEDYGGDNISNGSGGGEGDHGQHEGRPGPYEPFDPRRIPNERDLVMAMTDDGDGGMMDYFDQNFLKNWAGPEHWKLRKVVRRPDAAEVKAAKAPREKKEAFKIDFFSSSEKDIKEIAKDLFAPVTRGAGINLPGTGTAGAKSRRGRKTKEKEKRDDHRLPDDMHFSNRQLVTLFLKPKFALKMRGQRVRFNKGDGEVDENFWAQAAADQAAGRRDVDDADETANGGAIPFNTQFFHDDYDDGHGFDDLYEGEGEGAGMGAPEPDAGEQDLLAATQGQTRRVRPEFVNYAKRAKRVDVRKLKENIWKGLNIDTRPPEIERMDVDDQPPEPDPSEGRAFGTVITGLQRSYPREKMEEISTSFCFICLLHLANEQGLKLQSSEDALQIDEDTEDGLPSRKVGNIWDLKVYKDPEATPAA